MDATGDPLLASTPGRASPSGLASQALLQRARAGDRDAVDALSERYRERVLRVVRVRLGRELRRWTESGDVVQETFRSALAGREGLFPASEPDVLDWLARVATNRIRDLADRAHAARRDLRRAEPLEPARPRAAIATSETDIGERVFRREVRALLDEIVADLPEAYREVILWRDYHGASWPVVAEHLAHDSVHAVQQLHQRAWIKVRTLAAPRLADLHES